MGPSTSGVLQNGTFSISTIGFTTSNTTLPPLQMRNPPLWQDLYSTEISPLSTRQFPPLFDPPMLATNPLFETDRLASPLNIAPMQTRPEPIISLFSRPDYFSSRTLEARLLTLLELERRAFQTFEILFDSGIFEESKERGLNREQIDKIEVSEFEEKPQEKEPVTRIKSRNGIHKTPKVDPKKAIKAALQKEKSEPTSSSTCAICLEDYKHKDKLRKFPCSHKFHQECIDKWLSLKNNCPVCKGKPVEDSQPSAPRTENVSNQFENNDLLQLLTLRRPAESVQHSGMNSSVPRLTDLITDIHGLGRLRNTTPIIIDDNSDDVSMSHSSNQQPRRAENGRETTTGNRRSRANNNKAAH